MLPPSTRGSQTDVAMHRGIDYIIKCATNCVGHVEKTNWDDSCAVTCQSDFRGKEMGHIYLKMVSKHDYGLKPSLISIVIDKQPPKSESIILL